jgi:hypothetical protein
MIKLHQNIKLNPKLIFYSYYLLLSYDYIYSFEQMQDLLKIEFTKFVFIYILLIYNHVTYN